MRIIERAETELQLGHLDEAERLYRNVPMDSNASIDELLQTARQLVWRFHRDEQEYWIQYKEWLRRKGRHKNGSEEGAYMGAADCAGCLDEVSRLPDELFRLSGFIMGLDYKRGRLLLDLLPKAWGTTHVRERISREGTYWVPWIIDMHTREDMLIEWSCTDNLPDWNGLAHLLRRLWWEREQLGRSEEEDSTDD